MVMKGGRNEGWDQASLGNLERIHGAEDVKEHVANQVEWVCDVSKREAGRRRRRQPQGTVTKIWAHSARNTVHSGNGVIETLGG